MAEHRLEGQYGRDVVVDLCSACNGVWLDGMESHQLAPAGTLALFRQMAAHAGQAQPLSERKPCPRCGVRLRAGIDRQRSTAFEVFACPKGHGRYMTFLAFMRAKNFVRDLTVTEVNQLRRHIRTVKCVSCGASVDITKESVCQQCGTAIAMLDPDQLQRTVAELEAADQRRQNADPTLPFRLAEERLRTERVFAALAAHARTSPATQSWTLVDTGLRSLAAVLDALKTPD
jgi:Zn-finger nucleic acid-binding protein